MQNNYLMRDSDALGLTAGILDVSETRIFELAYQDWFGKPAHARDLEHAIVDYLFEGKMPCWVRAFTRNTMQLCDEAGMVLPLTQSGQHVTLVVSPSEMIFALMGLGAACLGWLVGML